MLLQSNPYSLPLFLSAGLALLVAGIAWRRQVAPGAHPLALLMLGLAIWAGGYAAQWTFTSLVELSICQNFTYIGVMIVPTTFLGFALQYTRRVHHFKNRWRFLLSLEPLASLVLFWTSPSHHLFHTGFYLDRSTPYIQIGWERGPLFWVNMVYSYALIAAGVLLLIRYALQRPPQRAQAYLVLVGALVPVAANIYNEFVIAIPLALDVTPISFIISGLLFAFALFRYHLLELAPIAHELLVENMSDGLLVLDNEGRIADINPAARRMIGVQRDPLDQPVQSVLAGQAELVQRFQNTPRAQAELELQPGFWLDLRITPILNRRQQQVGRMVVFRDISDRKQIEHDLLRVNEQLSSQVQQVNILRSQLEDQAVRDPLTGLFNRRYLDDTLGRDLSQAIRTRAPLSLVMVDIDHFKALNDTYGHRAGDFMLQALAGVLRDSVRAGDILCRYGGEEFLLALPGMDSESACKRAEEWRLSCARVVVPYEREHLQVTVSMGVAAFPEHGANQESLIRAADRALYTAKASGRNRVMVSGRRN